MGQLMQFECIGICVLSPAREYEVRGSLVYLLIVKYGFIDFVHIQLQYISLDSLYVEFLNFISKIIFRVC